LTPAPEPSGVVVVAAAVVGAGVVAGVASLAGFSTSSA